VLTAAYDGVRAFDGKSGRQRWEAEYTSSRLRAVRDADGDGTTTAFLGRVGGEVRAVDVGTGETDWTTDVAVEDDVIVPPPVTADVSGDGRREVLAATEAGRVVVLDPETGAELAAYERSVPMWTFPTSADLDGDGDAELLVRYGDGRVVALDYASGRPLSVGAT
jgi:outer membrane protein assembly factor BamB